MSSAGEVAEKIIREGFDEIAYNVYDDVYSGKIFFLQL